MAYTSIRGRKPLERASKISHAHVIANSTVQNLLSQCSVPRSADGHILQDLLLEVPSPLRQPIRVVIAVDGSMREVMVRDEFPSATLTFFSLGPLLFKLEALRELDQQAFIAPEDLTKLKTIQRYELALPTKNISRSGLSLLDSIRQSLHEFFSEAHSDTEPLYSTLRWLLFRQWQREAKSEWEVPSCPHPGCSQGAIVLSPSTPNELPCPSCGRSIYLIDVARLHERIDEEQGAGGISSYVLSLCEQVALVHMNRLIYEIKPSLLAEVLFIKDGPLACFGQIAPLSAPFREMVSFFGRQEIRHPDGARISLLNLAGFEKSGPFVDHAVSIERQLRPGTALLLSNEYIYRYIVPGDPASSDPYGSNTYWGSKLIFKATDGNTYVATVPTYDGFRSRPSYDDFINLTEVLAAVSDLRCSMYDNALIPVALANRLVSLSDSPSSRILETFAKDSLLRHTSPNGSVLNS